MNWLDYREKLGIAFNDDKKASYFMTRLFNVLDNYDDSNQVQISIQEYFIFCNITGTPVNTSGYDSWYERIIASLHTHKHSIRDFLTYYIAFVNCQKDEQHKPFTRQYYLDGICNILDESRIPYELFEDKDGYFIFPKGVPEFDNALVSQPLRWLSKYPNAEKAWSKALRAYSEATDENASEVADKFRKALEAFFREFFQANKSLENLKSEYGAYLKAHGVPKEISGNLETLYQTYTNYMNNYAKHRDATSDKVLEYLMYQTGNIMRLLITLK